MRKRKEKKKQLQNAAREQRKGRTIRSDNSARKESNGNVLKSEEDFKGGDQIGQR